ncbi:MAG: amidohydrolase family protein [Chitinophagaceae bacterium]|nr:amidohydrolase family protein [Chitinophagaceae bacterium]
MKKLIILPLLLFLGLHLSFSQDGKLPIIDMHQHAMNKMYRTENGEPLTRICHPSPYCKRIPAKVQTDEDILKFTLEAIKKFNIVKAVISGDDTSTVYAWKNKAAGIFLPGIIVDHPINSDINMIRTEIKKGNIKILGELTTQYSGLFPDDPVLAPYFDLAEEMDIPVQIHTTGSGAPSSAFSIQAGNPLHLENVLRNRPGLRIYLENAGWPFTAEMTALMYRYPNVYADLSTYTWMMPRATFYNHLKDLIDMGLGNRLMFGSDQMMWPEVIEEAINAINSAPFLTPEQKRDIFYNNAARFLRLSKEEIEAHHKK